MQQEITGKDLNYVIARVSGQFWKLQHTLHARFISSVAASELKRPPASDLLDEGVISKGSDCFTVSTASYIYDAAQLMLDQTDLEWK